MLPHRAIVPLLFAHNLCVVPLCWGGLMITVRVAIEHGLTGDGGDSIGPLGALWAHTRRRALSLREGFVEHFGNVPVKALKLMDWNLLPPLQGFYLDRYSCIAFPEIAALVSQREQRDHSFIPVEESFSTFEPGHRVLTFRAHT